MVFVFLFSYVPLLGWGLAFFDYKPGLSLEKIKFVGLKYFKLMFFYKEDILNALLNTLVLSFLSLAASVLPIVFAILLTEMRHTGVRKAIQTVVTLPHFVSWIIVYALCFALFSSSGMVSQVMMSLGLIDKPLGLMTNASTAWAFMTLLGIWKELGWNSIIYLAAMICVYPFYYMLCYAFSDPGEAMKGITFFPRGFTLENFEAVAQLGTIPQASLISAFLTFAGSAITLICCSFFGYLVSKREMYCRKFIYRFVIITMYVSGGLIPSYLVMRAYGLRNTLLVYIIPSAVSAYYVILIKTFIEQLPPSLEEAAKMEGAGLFTCYARIILPLSKPILATIALLADFYEKLEPEK